ncbi:hypothetical protein BC567DRAFT_238672 [Phyllosticta citribraziliensis]
MEPRGLRSLEVKSERREASRSLMNRSCLRWNRQRQGWLHRAWKSSQIRRFRTVAMRSQDQLCSNNMSSWGPSSPSSAIIAHSVPERVLVQFKKLSSQRSWSGEGDQVHISRVNFTTNFLSSTVAATTRFSSSSSRVQARPARVNRVLLSKTTGGRLLGQREKRILSDVRFRWKFRYT